VTSPRNSARIQFNSYLLLIVTPECNPLFDSYILDVVHPQVLNQTPTLDEQLDYFRNCSPEDISGLVTVVIPEDRLPLQYLESLSNEDGDAFGGIWYAT
jgi:hypothetical protein